MVEIKANHVCHLGGLAVSTAFSTIQPRSQKVLGSVPRWVGPLLHVLPAGLPLRCSHVPAKWKHGLRG